MEVWKVLKPLRVSSEKGLEKGLNLWLPWISFRILPPKNASNRFPPRKSPSNRGIGTEKSPSMVAEKLLTPTSATHPLLGII